jgi:hypothetical protein
MPLSDGEKIPTLSYFRGVPIGEMPREELEFEFVEAWVKIQELELKYAQLSVQHINDIAKLARR